MYSEYIKFFNQELKNKSVNGLKVRIITIDNVDNPTCTIHTDKMDIVFIIDSKTSLLSNLTRIYQCVINCAKTVY